MFSHSPRLSPVHVVLLEVRTAVEHANDLPDVGVGFHMRAVEGLQAVQLRLCNKEALPCRIDGELRRGCIFVEVFDALLVGFAELLEPSLLLREAMVVEVELLTLLCEFGILGW